MIIIFTWLNLETVFAADIIDFAPLTVGNTWKYEGTIPRIGISASVDSIVRILSVVSKQQGVDTNYYSISIRDSVYKRCCLNAGDTVYTTIDTVRES